MNIPKRIYTLLHNGGWGKNHWPIWLLEWANMKTYQVWMGYKFDLDNPKTFSEKIQWYKTRFRMPDQVRYVDKFLFKGLIEEKLGPGHTIPMYGAWTSIDDFCRDWKSLPDKFCLKSTLQSDGNYIKVIDKESTNLELLAEEVREWLEPNNLLINSYCTAYHKAVPRIMAEKYEESVKDQLYDYKFYCFNGEPYCVCASVNHFKEE